jgi:hypothetical protein
MQKHHFHIFRTIRANGKPLSSALLALLLGSWLSVFCTNCIAAVDIKDFAHYPAHASDQHCPPVKNTQNCDHDDESCLGVCDCDAITTVSVNKFDVKAVVVKLSTEHQYATFNQDIQNTSKNKNTSCTIAYRNPERSYFLPLDRFCVLLN